MSEGESGAKPEKPGGPPIKYKGYEIFTRDVVAGSVGHGKYEIWKGDEFIHAGELDVPTGRFNHIAMDAAERAAREWIDAQTEEEG